MAVGAGWRLRGRAGARPSSARGTRRCSYGLWPSACPRTMRLTFSAARRSSSATSPSAPVRSSAFTSMCAASTGASSVAQPGEDVDDAARHVGGREHLGELDRDERMRLRGDDHRGVAADERRARAASRARASGGSGGRRSPTTPVGSGIVKLKYGPATGFDGAERPARACRPSPRTRRRGRWRASTSSLPRRERGELAAPRLHHLGDPVEHLAAVVRGRPSPTPAGLPRAAGTASRRVLARGARDVLRPRRRACGPTRSAGTRRR